MKLRTIFAFTLFALGVGVWSWKREAHIVAPADGAIANASASSVPPSAPLSSSSTISSSIDPLANLDPFASLALRIDPLAFKSRANSVQTLRELQRGKTLAEAQVAAAMSDDPVVHVNSLHMLFPCMNEPVYLAGRHVRSTLERLTRDPKTGQPLPVSEAEVRFAALRANSGPQSIHPQEEVRAELKRRAELDLNTPVEKLRLRERDYERETKLWLQLRAPLSDTDKAAFEQIRDDLVEECGDKNFSRNASAAYQAQRDAFAARGVLSALIFNEKTAWTSSRTLSELSDRDFALVQRAFHEQDPGVLAMLLLRGGLFPSSELITFPDDAVDALMIVGMVAPKLTACSLNVADCGREGFIFQDACLMFGGCDQPDAFALWRYVLARDGLDPSVIDRVVADLVAKIRAGDLEALRIRRKK
jgi:hypothetical protein